MLQRSHCDESVTRLQVCRCYSDRAVIRWQRETAPGKQRIEAGGTLASILLIETEAPLVRLMSWFLLEAGFEVAKVDTTEEAVDRCRAGGPAVIVFNTGMAQEEKARSIRELRDASTDCRILDVSDDHPRPTVPADTGADAYLQLPFHADSFIESVTALYDASMSG